MITKALTKRCIAELAAHFEVHSIVDLDDPDAVLAVHGESIRGIAGGKVPGSMMEKLPKLEIIANSGVGVDSIDLETARTRGVVVTNTPGVLNDSVAELTIALMLALARRLQHADRFIRDGAWKHGPLPLGSELRGKTVGILGLGGIGKEIAVRLEALKMHVVYCGRNRQEDQPFRYFSNPVTMAAESDWLIVIAPGGEATRGIISRAVLEALGPTGRLVNVARGSLVDQAALIDTLRAGRLGGAALDVFASEPDVPDALLALDNVVVSPHQGSRTEEAREAMGQLVVANLRAHFGGRPVPSRVL